LSEIPYSIRRSERARHARIVVDASGVEVVVPRRMALRHVPPFVEEKRPWIERTLKRLREAEAAGPRVSLEDGGTVPYLGRQLTLRVHVERGRVRPHVTLRELPPLDPSAPELFPAEELHVKVGRPGPEALRDALERWYRRQARDEVEWRLDEATERTGTRYTRLTIRSQRTRWASCSDNGAMSFNWRLLLAPEEILDYVIEHEVAHLDVMDHSERFWALLGARVPEYKERERWLRRYGPALRL
jgi:predicted metal-dependent hydrolase